MSVPPDGVLDLKAFVPAKDLAVSTQFYLDLGFRLNFSNEEIALLEIGSFRIFLQPFYVKGHAENFVMQLMVDDVDAWWAHIQAIGLQEKYPGILARAPAVQSWGARVLFLSDPARVLWHITEPPPRLRANERVTPGASSRSS